MYGERKVVPDNFQELNVDIKHSSGELLRLTFRAYNEGAACAINTCRTTAMISN